MFWVLTTVVAVLTAVLGFGARELRQNVLELAKLSSFVEAFHEDYKFTMKEQGGLVLHREHDELVTRIVQLEKTSVMHREHDELTARVAALEAAGRK